MATMDDLIAFVRAQLDADERVARTAANLQFDPENGWGTHGPNTVTPHIGHIHDDEARQHIVRFNPARMLAEIDAKRRILDWLEDLATSDAVTWSFDHETPLRLLAQPYAGRDGWDPRWAL